MDCEVDIANQRRDSMPPAKLIEKAQLQNAINAHPSITQAELANTFDVGICTLRKELKRHGLQTSHKSRKDTARVRELFEHGIDTPREMAQALGIHKTTAENWMYELGLLERSKIRSVYPACVACGDPVDPSESTLGGIGALHYTCAQWMLKQPIVSPNFDSGETTR